MSVGGGGPLVTGIPGKKRFESINTWEGQKVQAVKIAELNKKSCCRSG